MRRPRRYFGSALAFLAAAIVFLVPFAFVILTAGKDRTEAAEMQFSWPATTHFLENQIGRASCRERV